MRRALPLLVALAVPAVAHGSTTLADELTASGTQSTAQNPRSGTWSNRLSGAFELSDAWELHGDLNLTHDNATPPQAGASFGQTGGNIFLLAFGADWLATDHLSLGAELTFSPQATQLSDTVVTVESTNNPNLFLDADALLKTVSSSAGALLSAGWMSSIASPESTAIDGSLSLTHVAATQSIDAVETDRGVVSGANLKAYCSRRTCPEGLATVLAAQPAKINQLRLGLNVTQTVRDDTDLTLGGGLYLYDRDPLEVGYFSVATVGRTYSMGAGVPIAPLSYTIRAGGTHRFFSNALSAGLWYSYARYVEDQGFGSSLGGKLQYRFSGGFRVWLSLSGSDDVDSSGAHSKSGSVSIGLRYPF